MRKALGVAVAGVALAAVPGTAQNAGGPKARYQMDISTTTGLGAMGQGGGMSAAMAMMGGGGGMNREVRSVELRLGSTLSPQGGSPAADHFLPPAMRMGVSVPLVTPTRQPVAREGSERNEMRTPRGRLLIYWGCGPKAGPGQPVVIDFSKMARGQVPPGLYSTRIPVDRGPSFSNSRTYGDWPNADRRSRTTVSPNSSLVGDHRVAGNYSPEIKFTLQQDFMGPLRLNSRSGAGGWTDLSWNSVAGATGYYAWAMAFDPSQARGEDDIGEMVWWASSARQEFGGGLADWLPPATVARLIGEKVVMPPSQTACQIPAEVKGNGRMMTLMMTAYGPEANFAFPPRPANPRLAWTPEWTAKARYRSTTMAMTGMPGMGDMMGSDDGERRPRSDGGQTPRKCGLLQRAAGLC